MIAREQQLDFELSLLVAAIYHKFQHDFRDYSPASFKRRVALAALQSKVLHDPDCFSTLLQYLTIPVSEMFRDASYFVSVRNRLAPVLRTYPSLKIWVAGCSTGENVYSLAILLHEEGLLEKTMIYATDINPENLRKAKAGVFSHEELQKFTSNYQKAGGTSSFSDYYNAGNDAAVFKHMLKKHIVFADHSLATDDVFSEMHFISCRNVLIYFNRNLQNRAIGLFHNSICKSGFLGLGSRESVQFSGYQLFFKTIVSEDRLFQKIAPEITALQVMS
jgi:chemotaxis protein methyltransferase CheR